MAQNKPKLPPGFDLNQWRSRTANQLSNMKQQQAAQLGQQMQLTSELIGKTYDAIMDMVSPLIMDYMRLQKENQALKTPTKTKKIQK